MNKSIKAKAFYSRKTSIKELDGLIQELENHLNWMLENDETLELTEVETKRFTESFSNIQQMFDGIN
ncbi:hypothetical protein [Planktothrix agardhii]|jgi:hypothetical protein|uniref:hypothetical protein n=1 Tax=Planktothrix agardhii TaxID=1160 RepID=UPI0020A796A9|nr:hypothetical protein [Planktothrix agardhii]CAD5985586.1 hypothetical protein NO365_04530 [Planktothrix agardhii]